MPEELRALMLRFTALGRLLPQGDEIDRDVALTDEQTRETVKLVLAEMEKVEAQVWAFLDEHRAKRRA
jgi:hypothetical protein